MVTATNNVTKRERDCLVLIGEKSDSRFPMRLHEIAENMRVSAPTAFSVVKRLMFKGLADSRDGMIMLTESGIETTKRILMVHRTYESLFCQSGVSEDVACLEASDIDFILPIENAKLVLKRIDSPSNCPHGKPISTVQ